MDNGLPSTIRYDSLATDLTEDHDVPENERGCWMLRRWVGWFPWAVESFAHDAFARKSRLVPLFFYFHRMESVTMFISGTFDTRPPRA